MTYTEKYDYWKMISDYDLGTAEDMIRAERWMYVASICYSAVGRMLKGLMIFNTRKEAPKSDNLVFLMNRLENSEEFAATEKGRLFAAEKNEYLDLIADITYYHVSDYPFSYKKVVDRFIGKETALEVYEKTKKVLLWFARFAPDGSEPAEA